MKMKFVVAIILVAAVSFGMTAAYGGQKGTKTAPTPTFPTSPYIPPPPSVEVERPPVSDQPLLDQPLFCPPYPTAVSRYCAPFFNFIFEPEDGSVCRKLITSGAYGDREVIGGYACRYDKEAFVEWLERSFGYRCPDGSELMSALPFSPFACQSSHPIPGDEWDCPCGYRFGGYRAGKGVYSFECYKSNHDAFAARICIYPGAFLMDWSEGGACCVFLED